MKGSILSKMINLVIALKCEAKPLIRHYGLKSRPNILPFPVYASDAMRLIVSGPGKTAASNAAACLYEISGRKADEAWLNIGVGGHAYFPIGAGFLAHKIKDTENKKSWYPPLLFECPPQTASVLTVSRVEKQYKSSWVYEMEAAGFVAAAVKYSTGELIHCYKMISDNSASPASRISASLVEHLLEKHLSTIDPLIKKMDALSNQLKDIQKEPEELARFLKEWHFTFSEQVQLKKLLRRWRALNPAENVWREEELLVLDSANKVIQRLRERVNQKPVLL